MIKTTEGASQWMNGYENCILGTWIDIIFIISLIKQYSCQNESLQQIEYRLMFFLNTINIYIYNYYYYKHSLLFGVAEIHWHNPWSAALVVTWQNPVSLWRSPAATVMAGESLVYWFGQCFCALSCTAFWGSLATCAQQGVLGDPCCQNSV